MNTPRPVAAPAPARRPHPRGGVPVGGLALLVVLVIILLMFVANGGGGSSYVQNVANARNKGREMEVAIDTRSIIQMVTAYQLENNRYPATFADMEMTPPKDAWGSELTFTIDTTSRPTTIIVTSPGKDGELGTEDDIIKREALSI